MDPNRVLFLGVILGFALFALYLLHPESPTASPTNASPLLSHLNDAQANTETTNNANNIHQRRPPLIESKTIPTESLSISSTPKIEPLTSHSFGTSKTDQQQKVTVENKLPTTPTTQEEQKSDLLKRIDGKDPNIACRKLKKKYDVVPGSSWGSLPVKFQKVWSEMNCDAVFRYAESPAEPSRNFHMMEEQPVPTIPEDKEPTKLNKGSDAEWCWSTRKKFQVQPMVSWGRLSENDIQIWKRKQCDFIFTGERLAKVPLSSCPASGFSNSSGEVHPNMAATLPLISIMAATTTRKIENPSTANLALFAYLLPTLIRTLDCGFRYEYVLGYDAGDPFYDSKEGMKEVKGWFAVNVQKPMEKNGILLTLRLVRVNNTLKKPGPVFLEMARAAYDGGAHYFYRVNDDTELSATWPKLFVKTLQSLSSPYGVVGPNCQQGNQKILTHDFVHRIHMDIFEMNYYPPQLTDWWMDDWISLVYGQTRTFKAKNAPVVHHTGAHGQRYAVDESHRGLLGDLVKEGRKKIRQFMLKHEIDDKTLETFDKDNYVAGFMHRDVPANVKSELKLH